MTVDQIATAKADANFWAASRGSVPRDESKRLAAHVIALAAECERLGAELARLRAAERWIPCAERMPSIADRVMFGRGLEIYVGHLGISGWHTPTNTFRTDSITHWRPLPAPPAQAPTT